MSRIHEALQKAEHERAAAQGGRPQPNQVDVPSEPSVIPIEEKPSAEGITENPSNRGIPLASTMPSFAGPFNLDAMMARCLPQSWAPDVQTMLFFNGDDNVRGARRVSDAAFPSAIPCVKRWG